MGESASARDALGVQGAVRRVKPGVRARLK
jgi:hypothetical protein